MIVMLVIENWNSGMESKDLKVNTKKTMVVISYPDVGLFTSLGNIPVDSVQKGLEAIRYQISCK